MSTAVLGLAAILALAADPRCGKAAAGSEYQSRLAAIAIHESGGDPLIIGVNADRPRGLPAMVLRSATAQEAAARAAALIAQGRSIDLGLMQINSGQLAGHGLTVETAFEACRNMAAGAEHYAADVRAVWSLAHRRYNSGSTERGGAYAASVEAIMPRVRSQQAAAPASTVAPSPAPPPPPAAPPCAPAWDAWALAQCNARPAPPVAPSPANDPAAVPVITATIGDPDAATRP